MSEQVGEDDRAKTLERMLKDRMEKWFRERADSFRVSIKNVGSPGYPEEYFSASMNDHHFHYGYWLMAAHIAKRGSRLAHSGAVGKMVDLIARDIATSERGRDDFPLHKKF